MPVDWSEFEPETSAAPAAMPDKVDWNEFTPEPVAHIKLSPYEEAKLKGADEGMFAGGPAAREERMREAGDIYASLLRAPVSTQGEITPFDVMAGLGPLKAAMQRPETAPIAKVAAVPVEFAASQVTPANALLAGLGANPALAPFVKAAFLGMGIKGALESGIRAQETQTPEDIATAILAQGIAPLVMAAPIPKAKPPIIEAARPILPESAKAVEETPTAKGAEYARSEQEAATVYGDVRPQPVEGVREVPAEISGEGVQPQAKEGIPSAPPGQERVLLTPEEQAPPTRRENLIISPRTDGLVSLQDVNRNTISTFKSADDAAKWAIQNGYGIAAGSPLKPTQTKQGFSGVFITEESKNMLLKMIPPEHKNVFGDHVTIEYGVDKPHPMSGTKVRLTILGYAVDAKGKAVFVEGVDSQNRHPHITISTAEGVEPFYSNELLAKNRIIKLKEPITVEGTVGTKMPSGEMVLKSVQKFEDQPTPPPETKSPWQLTYDDFYDDVIRGQPTVLTDQGKVVSGWDHAEAKDRAEDSGLSISGPLGSKAGWWRFGKNFLARDLDKKETHRVLVEQALREGKPVPKDVIEEYPELKSKLTAAAQERPAAELGQEPKPSPVEAEKAEPTVPPAAAMVSEAKPVAVTAEPPAISEPTTAPEKTQAAWPWPNESQWTLQRLRSITPEERANRSKFIGLKKPDGSWETAPAKIAEVAQKRLAEMRTEAPKAEPPSQEIIGMGGAVPSELAGGFGGDIYGIAERVRQTRAKAGQVPEIEKGQGVSWQETIARGRQALAKDPLAAEKAEQAFKQTKAINESGIEVTRAKGEEMFNIARNVEEKFGTESPEYLAAMDAGFRWDKISKEMQTEWHRAGQAQQGATELDTGDIIELERAYHQSTDKPFTPKQRKLAEEVAGKVRVARQQETEAFQKLYQQLDLALGHVDVKPPVDAREARLLFAKFATGDQLTPQQIKTIWEWTKKAYLSKGDRNLEAIAQGVSDDLGLPKLDVIRALASPKGVRKLTDETYLRMARSRQAVNSAKNWLNNQTMPGWERFLRKVPRAFFMAKVFGHGTVGMVTHAGPMMFDPGAAKVYWPEFFRQYKLLVSAGYHEQMMQRLQADPYFITARRSGLANDPFRYQDDYQNPKLTSWVGRWGLAGNRGFDSLKLVRQARWNQIWDSLPDELRTPEMAKLVSNGVNHATGITTSNLIGKMAEPAAVALFAPKLEMSRWALAIGDPVKASKIFINWKNEGPEARAFAMSELKQKARITGTYFSLLALNQSILIASGSDQRINFDNPRRGDFLAFKIAGQNVSVISPLLHMVGLFARLWHDSTAARKGVEAVTGRGEAMGQDIWSYGRGKLSPFAAPIVDVATQQTFDQRPMPFSADRVPAWMRRQGKGRWSWPEYLIETAAPIPASEAIREVWKSQGMEESDMERAMKALAVFTITGGTGIRLTEDKRRVPSVATTPQ